jgi:PAS domain S-box-containing protein
VGVSGDGLIQLVNQRTEQMFGYTREELLGRELDILLPERYRAAHVHHRVSYFAQPRVRTMGAGMALAGRRKDGTEFPVEIGLGYVQTGHGQLALGLISDITERKKTEAELARLNTELKRSNEELAQFASIASHDLQEPLRMITGYLDLLVRRQQDRLDSESREFIQYALDGATRMKNLIEDLLRLSRTGTQAVNFREVKAEEILDAACANLHTAIEQSGAIVTYGPLPAIVADAGLLTQVFQNLIGNAIKFCAQGTRPCVEISAQRHQNSWFFSVRDNGIGIDPHHRERIFRMFERLHSSEEYSGSGVGLAIAKRVLERHGGRIWLELSSASGSIFSFSVPDRGSSAPQAAIAGWNS